MKISNEEDVGLKESPRIKAHEFMRAIEEYIAKLDIRQGKGEFEGEPLGGCASMNN